MKIKSNLDDFEMKSLESSEEVLEECVRLDQEKYSSVRESSNVPEDLDTEGLLEEVREKTFEESLALGVTVGAQGSGKTSFLQSYFSDFQLSIDDELVPEFRESRTKEDRKEAFQVMELTGMVLDPETYGMEEWVGKKVNERIEEGLGDSKSIIIDGIHPEEKSRRPYMRRAEEYGAKKIGFLFDVPFRKCFSRCTEREKGEEEKKVGVHDFLRYFSNLELPIQDSVPAEGLDLVLVIDEDHSLTNFYPPEILPEYS